MCNQRPPVVTDSLLLTVVLCLPSSALQNTHMPLLQEKQVCIIRMLINISHDQHCLVHIHHPPGSPHLHRVCQHIRRLSVSLRAATLFVHETCAFSLSSQFTL